MLLRSLTLCSFLLLGWNRARTEANEAFDPRVDRVAYFIERYAPTAGESILESSEPRHVIEYEGGRYVSPYDDDLDDYVPWHERVRTYDECSEQWTWQLLPDGILYRSYLAGVKEPRFSSAWVSKNDGDVWDVTLGGRAPIVRYGTCDHFRPEGWQVDIEGAAMPRLDLDHNRDLVSSDFRFGIPVTYAIGVLETKLAYYHLSSHVGDEYLVNHPGFQRINYSRDAVVVGIATYPTDDVRVYGEIGYAPIVSGGSEPWEFQFGVEYSPAAPSGFRGAPFAATNAHLRQEVEFGGEFTIQAGWQWRGDGSRHLLRAGLQYFNGKSPQYEFFENSERQIALVIWYDN